MTSQFPTFPTRVFIDTSGYYALADSGDANYSAAKAILAQLADKRTPLFTTNFVLAEAHALLLSKLGRVAAARFLQDADRSSMTIVRANRQDEQRARAIIYQYEDKDFSLTDAVSFAVMERLSITRAFAFDRHFAQYGFRLLTVERF